MVISRKQSRIAEAIRGRIAKQIYLIGSLGTSKTYGAAHAMLSVAHNFPGSVLVVGRKNLTELKRGTLFSFHEVAEDMNLTGYIATRSPAEWRFHNGSLIMFVEGRPVPYEIHQCCEWGVLSCQFP
jgi:phage terminase large subunit